MKRASRDVLSHPSAARLGWSFLLQASDVPDGDGCEQR
jgi:hypothetical protein